MVNERAYRGCVSRNFVDPTCERLAKCSAQDDETVRFSDWSKSNRSDLSLREGVDGGVCEFRVDIGDRQDWRHLGADCPGLAENIVLKLIYFPLDVPGQPQEQERVVFLCHGHMVE